MVESESNISFDMKKEMEIGEFLDEYFYPKLNSIYQNCKIIDTERIFDSNKQHRGIDLTIEYENGKKVNIDEKAAATYFNKDIPTFSLEIFFHNINKLEICSVKKSALQEDIDKRFNLNRNNYYEYCLNKMHEVGSKPYDWNNKDYVKSKSEKAYWRVSEDVKERPFLMLYYKDMLKQICQSWFIVTKDNVKVVK
ncbi:hypothetical protein [Staphylococcus haemolyticus]|uniref:hypothetical protein n=1 Tax=Staphylococcus haemolyticus TaxID=1283 RepID=UPI0034D5BEAE